MANPTAKVTEYCGVLSRSRLMTPTDVTTLHSRWQSEMNGAEEEVDGFRKYLVTHKYLTEYQAAMVQRGHSDGFYIGGYVILDRIGKGQMAGVYKAVHESGQLVALKVLSSSKSRNTHVLNRFQREGRLLTQLNHANVVRAFQIASTTEANNPGLHYIVMEHLEGETLDEALGRRKKFPPAEAVRIIAHALQGLQHLHDRRMIHRDLKPANLMIVRGNSPSKTDSTLDSTVKILDIGLGRELFTEDGADKNDSMLTAEGAILGTPDYTAPEQARDARSADIRSDIYSLGCALYHGLAGRPPFVEKTVMATMVKHATEAPPPIQQFCPAVPPGLVIVLNRMLSKDPTARYQTPLEAVTALRPFLPPNVVGAVGTQVLPGYQQYLDSEQGDMPTPAAVNGMPKTPPPNGASVRVNPDSSMPAPLPRSGGVQGPPSGKIRVGGLAASTPNGPPPMEPKPKATVSGPPSGKIRVGTGLAAALATASTQHPSTAAPPGMKPGSLPPRPSPVPPSSPVGLANPSGVQRGLVDADVELIPLQNQVAEPADVLQLRMEQSQMLRPLYDLDRRDFIMLSAGAFGVLSAIGLGLVIAKVQGDRSRRVPQQEGTLDQ
jgi:eukaryotic-like serine/threonine-protein kinase